MSPHTHTPPPHPHQGLIMWHKGRYVLGERGASHDAVGAAAAAASHLLHAPCAPDGPVAESIDVAAAADAAGLSTTAAASLATLALANDHGRGIQGASRDGSGALGPAVRSSGGTGTGASGRLTAAMAALALASPSAATNTRPAQPHAHLHSHVHLQTSRWCGGGLARGSPEAQDLYQVGVWAARPGGQGKGGAGSPGCKEHRRPSGHRVARLQLQCA